MNAPKVTTRLIWPEGNPLGYVLIVRFDGRRRAIWNTHCKNYSTASDQAAAKVRDLLAFHRAITRPSNSSRFRMGL